MKYYDKEFSIWDNAATLDKRIGGNHWGDGERRFFGDKHWNEPLKWNKAAEKSGTRAKVFCASMADVFEASEVHAVALAAARTRLWQLIEATPHLDWLLLTKRPQNINAYVPDEWLMKSFPSNVWVGTSIENQAAIERLEHLLDVPAKVRFLSCEPLLGMVDLGLDAWWHPDYDRSRPASTIAGAKQLKDLLHWVIVGGESGHGARPMERQWARFVRNQCEENKVPFFFKQHGEWIGNEVAMVRVGKKEAGRLLDGREWNEVPEVKR